MKAVESINHKTVKNFVEKNISEDQIVYSDTLPTLNIINQTQQHEARVTPCQ